MESRGTVIALGIIIIGVLGLAYVYTFNRGVDNDRAVDISINYLEGIGEPGITIDEIMEFEYNYYVIYSEEETNIGAFEMLIDKESGQIFPEYGPNMMWNLKYGHGGMMGGWGMMGSSNPLPANEVMAESTALEIAQRFLDASYSGSLAEDPHPFYGYYTIHTHRDGEVFGMLSVNQYTGEVWYHNWHGDFVRDVEVN